MKPRKLRVLAGGVASLALAFAAIILVDYYRQQRAAAERVASLYESRMRNTPIELLNPDLQAKLPDDIVPFFDLYAGLDDKRRQAALAKIEQNWHPGNATMLLELLSPLPYPLPETDPVWQLLARKTGHDAGKDISGWHQWIWSNVPDTHPRYAEFKAFCYSQVDRRFEKYFPPGVAHTIRLDEIRWGGVSQDGIPPLVQPKCIEVGDAAYLEDGHLVFGVYVDGQARAYPQRILGWHELVRDRLGTIDITGVYCTLCKTMIVYRSQARERSFTLGTSGFLYRSNKLMFDQETQSLWSTLEGRPVVGALVGHNIQLESLPVVTTTWGEWRKRHPQTTVLSLDTGHERDYGEGVAYRRYFGSDDVWYVVPHVNKALQNKAEVVCLRDPDLPDEPVAYHTEFLKTNPLHEERVGKIDVVIVTDASGAARAYERRGRHFTAWDGKENVVDDAGADWTVSEDALTDGSTRLRRLPTHRAFWFAWHAAYPGARLVK